MDNSAPEFQLDQLIPGEIKHDEFYRIIQALVSRAEIKTVLEIGSSSGEGSTEAFVIGLRQNPGQPQLCCMEISKARFAELANRYQNDAFVNAYNISSVSVEGFASEQDVVRFYETVGRSHDKPTDAVDAAAMRVLHVSASALRSQWRGYVRSELR